MPQVVSLVACGPSAIHCGARDAPGYVVAINGAVDHIMSDAVLTMDGRFTRERADDIAVTRKPFYVRRKAWDKVRYTHTNPQRVEFGCQIDSLTFARRRYPDDSLFLNGGHSGYCALNLAFELEPKTVFLYGYDLGECAHFFGDYEWHGQGSTNNFVKFAVWAEEMHEARRQFDAAGIRVINTNRHSAITAFEFGTP